MVIKFVLFSAAWPFVNKRKKFTTQTTQKFKFSKEYL